MYTSFDSIELSVGTKHLLNALRPITWLGKALPRNHMTLIIYKLLANCDGITLRYVRTINLRQNSARVAVCMKRSFAIRASELKR